MCFFTKKALTFFKIATQTALEMHEAKSTTVEDVRAIADRFDALLENGVISSSGTASTIEANKKLFDSVIDLSAK